MSSTTTVTQTRTAETVLDDYALRHTGGSSSGVKPAPTAATVESINSSSSASAAGDGPVAPIPWDNTHRRVPPYRPIRRDRDVSQIRVYQNRIEQIFVGTMFTGVFLNEARANAARWAFGDKFRNFVIGGEM
ncbi:uncharacterized protein B0I36DRAFT_337655 [Microdochium trichocladiopsis]|uniref:Uncharacterized protein n=1 Tax=Microdochium trichocladiopsis TaxID=1682393 RepID=A0A9P8XTE9_9PEZI|nr:uncharacterized protein B0I36DRAFT_337655 [Microdochium trichocladiopsis]KAH7016425.1 hypothetical protein B0I36DRAFT_337655 [Microdochium trichocladiopsis]